MQNNTNILYLIPLRTMGDYSCGTYGANTYNSACTTTSTGGNSGGFLADTGYNVLLPVALGLAVLLAGAILLVKRLKRRQHNAKVK